MRELSPEFEKLYEKHYLAEMQAPGKKKPTASAKSSLD